MNPLNNVEFINYDFTVLAEDEQMKDNYQNFNLSDFLRKDDYEKGPSLEESLLNSSNNSSFLSEPPISMEQISLANNSDQQDPQITVSTSACRPMKSNSMDFIETIYRCSFGDCLKSFKSKLTLDRHMMSHTAKKMYMCTEKGCGKAYKSKENLTLHVKNIHLNEKPYLCKFCSADFTHRNGKIYHERKFHTHIFPYRCQYEECSMAYPSKSALKYHFNSAHIGMTTIDKKNKRKSKFIQDIIEIVGNNKTLEENQSD